MSLTPAYQKARQALVEFLKSSVAKAPPRLGPQVA